MSWRSQTVVELHEHHLLSLAEHEDPAVQAQAYVAIALLEIAHAIQSRS